jgi:hypothetical protein
MTYEAHTVRSDASKPHLALALGAFHPEGNVDAAVELVHLTADPWNLLREVDFVAENLTSPRRRPQCVQRAADHARGRLLIVEDTQHCSTDNHHEDREASQPASAVVN